MTKLLLSTAAGGLLALALLLAAGGATAAAAGCKGGDVPAYEVRGKKAAKATLCLLNKRRASHGLRALRAERHQGKAARRHNRLMIRRDCFSHLCPSERDLVGRLTAAGYLPCSCSWLVGENIAYASGSVSSPRGIVGLWMDSPPHRENILNPRFEHIGVAVNHGSPGGSRRGSATFTTDFGAKG
jgi:uncharacterized protein YkwD